MEQCKKLRCCGNCKFILQSFKISEQSELNIICSLNNYETISQQVCNKWEFDEMTFEKRIEWKRKNFHIN